jgi:tight adherence protein C
MSPTFLYITLGVTVFCAVALLAAPLIMEPSREAQHIIQVVAGRKEEKQEKKRKSTATSLLQLSTSARSRLGFGENQKLKRRLLAAGFRSANAPDAFFSVQCLLPLAGAFAGTFLHENTFFMCLLLGMLGFIAPDFWLSRRMAQRKNQIRKSMPDAIDLLVICVDAGLGLDQAMLRVTEELKISHPQIHEEFNQVILEQRAGQPRLEAWQNLAKRTNVEEFSSFAGMLTQTDRFGTPIVKALQRFAEDLRQRRTQRAEEAAEKTKIKIIFPLMLIFLCLLIVMVGPPVISIVYGLKGLGK